MSTNIPLNDKMLGQFKEANQEVSVYLTNGVKISGRIVEFDKDTLILTSEAGPEGVTINRAGLATMTRRVEATSTRQDGARTGPHIPMRRPQGR